MKIIFYRKKLSEIKELNKFSTQQKEFHSLNLKNFHIINIKKTFYKNRKFCDQIK
jgi:hypothetical protein